MIILVIIQTFEQACTVTLWLQPKDELAAKAIPGIRNRCTFIPYTAWLVLGTITGVYTPGPPDWPFTSK